MNEWKRPLEIAFMGYNDNLTRIAFIQFARDNAEEIAEHRRTWCEYHANGYELLPSPGGI